MITLWFNQGYSSIGDALAMIREQQDGCIRLLASHRDQYAPVLRAADLVLQEPAIDAARSDAQAQYLRYCLDMCIQQKVGFFFAQTARAMLSEHRDAFREIGTQLVVPADGETLRTIDDKAKFFAAAIQSDLPMPVTREITSPAEFDDACSELKNAGFEPCIKPPEGVFGNGFWRLDDDRSLFSTLMNSDTRRIAPSLVRQALQDGSSAKRLLVLEYLAGPEWSIDCVCKNGRLIAGVSRRKSGRSQKLAASGPEFDVAVKAVAAFGLSGLINVQCRAADPGGQDIRLLEINTRMSGGCAYTRHAGINLPWLYVALEAGLITEEEASSATPHDAVVMPYMTSDVVSPKAAEMMHRYA